LFYLSIDREFPVGIYLEIERRGTKIFNVFTIPRRSISR